MLAEPRDVSGGRGESVKLIQLRDVRLFRRVEQSFHLVTQIYGKLVE